MIVLNGTREGLFLGAIAAKRYVGARAGKPASSFPIRFMPPIGRRAAAECEPVYMPTTRETGFLPDLDAHRRRVAGTHRRLLHRLAVEPARRGRRPRLSHALVGMARRFGFLIFADECYCEIYLNGEHPPACSKVSRPDFANRRVPLAVEAFRSARTARRLCRRRPSVSSSRYIELRNIAAPAGAGAGAGGRDRGLCRRGACR